MFFSLLRSARFGMPQTRKRVYALMVRKHMTDEAGMDTLACLMTNFLPGRFTSRSTVQEIVAYRMSVVNNMGLEPHDPPQAKDPKPKAFVGLFVSRVQS